MVQTQRKTHVITRKTLAACTVEELCYIVASYAKEEPCLFCKEVSEEPVLVCVLDSNGNLLIFTPCANHLPIELRPPQSKSI